MYADKPVLPSKESIMRHVLSALKRYWPKNANLIAALPIEQSKTFVNIQNPLRLLPVQLPSWSQCWAIDGVLLVPQELVPTKHSAPYTELWQNVDWFLAVFLLLEGWHERLWEAERGSIHSYSFRLKGWDERLWQHAWVNRIGLFMRSWAAHCKNVSPESLFGTLPQTEIQMTHDVDAINKTLAIRLKQGVFTGLNAVRALVCGNLKESLRRMRKGIRFFWGRENWWKFDELLAAERSAGIRSVFHFYADERSKTLKRWLFDPNYDIKIPRIKLLIKQIFDDQHQIGLHPGYENWDDDNAIAQQKRALEKVSDSSVVACRQHWLRFSWLDTWSAQEKAGIRMDRTLMFNDRPGFRNASALCWQPWNATRQTTHELQAQVSVLMDSHLYDYQQLTDTQRRQQIRSWLSECHAVHGQVAVLWHPHTLTEDYGWGQGFSDLLQTMQEMKTR